MAKGGALRVRIIGDASHLQKTLDGTGGVLGKWAKRAGAAFTGAAVAAGVFGVKVASDMQQAEIAFGTMLGSAEKAKTFLSDLKSFAAATPFELPGLIDGSRRLLAMGFAADEIKPTLTAVGDTVSALGAGQDGIDRITRALGQMSAKGKVSAEEMLQLAEIGVPAWDILAETMGVSVAEAQKLASQGKITADTFINAFVDMEGPLDKFKGSMEAQSQTFSGLMSTLKDTVSQGLGELMVPLMEGLTRVLPGAIEVAKTAFDSLGAWWADNGPAITAAAQTLWNGLKTVFTAIGDAVSTVIGWFRRNREEVGTATDGILAKVGPVWAQIRGVIGSAMDAIKAIVDTGVKIIRNLWDRFGEHIWSFIKRSFDNVMQVIRGALTVIKGVFDVIAGVLTGDWRRAWEGIKNIVTGVWQILVGAVKQGIEFVRTAIGAGVAGISALWSLGWNALKTALSSAWEGIKSGVQTGIDNVLGWVRGIPDRVVSALGSMANLLKNAGREILNGLWAGLKEKWTDVRDWVGGLGGKIRDLKGPIEKDRKLLVAEGMAIMEGLGAGIQRGWLGVRNLLAGLSAEAVEAVQAAIETANAGVDAITGAFGGVAGRFGAARTLQGARSELSDAQARKQALPRELMVAEAVVRRMRAKAAEITLEEEQAILRAKQGVAEAEADLAETRTDGEATAEDLRLAEIAFDLARQNLTRTEREAKGTTRELEDAEERLARLREEEQGIDARLIAAKESVTEAQLRAIQAEKAFEEATRALTEQGEAGVDTFRRLAEAAGLTQQEITRLIRLMDTIPGTVGRPVSSGGGSSTPGAGSSSSGGSSSGDGGRVQALLDRLQHPSLDPARAASYRDELRRRGVPGFARGGVARGLALVGEDGPELVHVGSPSRVHSAPETARMLGRNKPQPIENHFHFPSYIGDQRELQRWLEQNVVSALVAAQNHRGSIPIRTR